LELRRIATTEVLGSLTSEACAVKQTSARGLTYPVRDREARRRRLRERLRVKLADMLGRSELAFYG